jgi:nicotinamidase-related amidase
VTKALLVIDIQESFRQRENWARVSTPDIAARGAELVDIARRAGDLVVWVLHSEPGTGNPFDPATGHVRLLDGLAPAAGEPVLTKTSRNAFTTTNLQQILTEQGIRELVICGIQTEQCCETTARVGADLGFDVTYVTEATATFPIPHRSGVGELGVENIIERTEYALSGRFATISTIAELAVG